MKVYRYISIKEFAKMSSGVPMRNRTPHYRYSRTSSMGFCFLPEKVVCTREKIRRKHGTRRVFQIHSTITPEEAWEFLDGIFSNDVLVEFEAPEECFQKSTGTYADPDHFYDFYSEGMYFIDVDELCTTEYDRDRFIPLCYAMVDFGDFDWYAYH